MITKSQLEAGGPLSFTMDKELLKLVPKVANDPFYSIEANWYRVSFVFKHDESKKRFVPSFKNFSSTKKLRIRNGMNGGDGYSLKKIIISKSDRSHLVIKTDEIPNVLNFAFSLMGSGVASQLTAVHWTSITEYPIYSPAENPTTLTRDDSAFYDSVGISSLSLGSISNGVASSDIDISFTVDTATINRDVRFGLKGGSTPPTLASIDPTYGGLTFILTGGSSWMSFRSDYLSTNFQIDNANQVRLIRIFITGSSVQVFVDGEIKNTLTLTSDFNYENVYPFVHGSFPHTVSAEAVVVSQEQTNGGVASNALIHFLMDSFDGNNKTYDSSQNFAITLSSSDYIGVGRSGSGGIYNWGNSKVVTIDDCFSGKQEMTFSCWFYKNGNSYSPGQNLLLIEGLNGAGMSLVMKPGGGGFIFSFNTPNGSSDVIDSSYGFGNGEWNHIVVTISDLEIVLYKNMQEIGRVNNPVNKLSQISSGDFTGFWVMSGTSCTMDDLKVYDNALTSQEVSNLYIFDSEVAPPVNLIHFAMESMDANNRTFDESGVYPIELMAGASLVSGGKSGNCIELNGSNQYATIPDIISGHSEVTISTWFKITTNTEWQRVFDFGSGSSTYLFLTPRTNHTGSLRFTMVRNGSWATEDVVDTNIATSLDTWYHAAVTITNSKIELFINGVSAGSKLNPSNLISEFVSGELTSNYIGKSQFPADPYFSGKVDELKIFDRMLSSEEISNLYANGTV